MLRWFHINLKSLARSTLAVAGTVWLIAAAAPCVEAQMDAIPAPVACPEQGRHAGQHSAPMSQCDPLTLLNCQLPDTRAPLTAGFTDFAVVPVVLALLPLPDFRAVPVRIPRHELIVHKTPAPPLHIRHLTLLI